MTTDDQLLTIPEVAMRLRVSAPTVRRKLAAGELTAVQLGSRKSAIRIPSRELQRYLVDHAVSRKVPA